MAMQPDNPNELWAPAYYPHLNNHVPDLSMLPNLHGFGADPLGQGEPWMGPMFPVLPDQDPALGPPILPLAGHAPNRRIPAADAALPQASPDYPLAAARPPQPPPSVPQQSI